MSLRTITILAALAAVGISPASAQGYRVVRGYGAAAPAYAQGYGYGGFARPFVQGDYIGAPLTVVPRPNRLVPTPWSYGTYGVPTVSGIAPAPVAAPTLTVIRDARPRTAGGRAGEGPAGVHVVEVSVPRR